MREAKVEYDDIADMHWWMVDHIHYLPAMIYAVLLIDIVSIVVIIKHSKGLGQDEILERLKIGCSVAVFLLGMLLVYYIVGCPVRCSEKQMLKSPDKLLI